MRRQLFELSCIVLVMLCARAALADHYVVPSTSMEPTVQVGDHIIVDKRAYGLRVPLTHFYVWRSHPVSPGDVVVLDSPADDRVLLKRVVATEGMLVQVREGRLSLNGVEQPLRGDVEQLSSVAHFISLEHGGGPDFGPAIVPRGQALVMGDNRGNSFDGRSFGFVDTAAILGRARALITPPFSLTLL